MKVRISNKNIKKMFFDSVQNNFNKTWKEIRKELNLSKSSLERYKSGKSLIPEELFLKFINILNNIEKGKILENVEKIPDNFGQIKGGKKAYSINFKKFEEGRKKGLVSLSKSRRKKFREIKRFIFNIKISPEICEFVGAFIGDGFFNCYNNKLYQVEFAGDSRFDLNYYEEKIIPIVKRIIPNIKPHIYKVKNKNSIRIVFYSKELFCFLRDSFGFIPGRKAHTIKIPSEILKSKELLNATIRGIFDTDGGIFLDRRKGYKQPYPRIIFQTVSEDLYYQLLNYLSEDFKIYSRYNEKRNIYVIEIYGHSQLKKWMSIIGFSNKRHLNKIASVA